MSIDLRSQPTAPPDPPRRASGTGVDRPGERIAPVPDAVDQRFEAALVARDRRIAELQSRVDELFEWLEAVEDWALQAVRHADRVAGIR